MSVFFFTDARFYKTPDGAIYAGEYSFSDVLWSRYQKAFGDVFIIARMFEVDDFLNKKHIIQNATVLPLPPFESPITFLKNIKKIKGLVMEYYEFYQPKAVIVRGSGSIGHVAAKLCHNHKIKYGIEVVGDPYDVYAPGVIEHPLRVVFRNLFTYYQKKDVKNASSVLYVTQNKLQQRYPCNENAFQTYASDVVINELVQKSKVLEAKDVYKIISVGSLEQMYKGPDVLLRAIKVLIDNDVKVTLTWLGHGQYLEEMVELASKLNISDYIDFVGSVNTNRLIQYLDESDVFVLASRTEGLPRAIVEAMARALPCVGTNVGGIPELISNELLVDNENCNQISEKIRFLISDKIFYNNMSKFSLEVAANYQEGILNARRELFFKSL